MQGRAAGLTGVVSELARLVAQAAVSLALLVLMFVLGTAYGALQVLRAVAPALLRAACVGLFVAGLVAGALGVGWLYADLTDLMGGILVAIALSWLLVANVMLQRDRIWAAFALSGALGLCVFYLLPHLGTNAEFVFVMRGVPVSLALAALVYLMLKFKGEKYHVRTQQPLGPAHARDQDGPRQV